MSFQIFQNQLLITTDDDCNATVITPTFTTGENVVSNFTLGSTVFNLEVTPGRTYVEDGGLQSTVLGGEVISNHFVQPMTIFTL